MTDRDVPPLVSVGDIGRACGWSTVRAKRTMQRSGIARKLGSHWVVDWPRLRDREPAIAEKVFEHFVFRDGNDRNRSQTIAGDR